jgi:alpha-beta hydrolase superfamily lysophospholipase
VKKVSSWLAWSDARQHSAAVLLNAAPWMDCHHRRRLPPAPAPLAAAAARGTVLIVHGLGEHIGRYEAVAAALNAAGWHVVGYDQRGHGRSEGRARCGARRRQPAARPGRGDRRLRGRRPPLLLGHSMGGLVAARFVAEALQPARALVAAGGRPGAVVAGAGRRPGRRQKLLLAVLGPLAPDLRGEQRPEAEWISATPRWCAAYDADPLVHDRITPRLVRFIVDGGAFVRGWRRWRVPTLLLWAGADRCVAPAGSAAFAAAAPRRRCCSAGIPGLYHEIFNEPERERCSAT